MAPPQSRDWAPRPRVPPPLPAPAAETVERYRTPYLVAVAWGTAWRYATVGIIVLLIFAGLRPPLLLGGVVGVAGFLAGLWFRRPWWAGAWRAAMLGWGLGMASAHWFFAYVVVGTLAAITLEPWIVARGRPWRTAGRRPR
jgi:hypothetical protein